MPTAQKEVPNSPRRKCVKWTEDEDKRLLRLRGADREITASEFCRKVQVHFPNRSENALAQRFSTLRNLEERKRPRRLIVTLKLPKRPLSPTTNTMAQANPSKQPRLAGRHEEGMNCDVAPPIQIGQILPQNNPQYPQYTAPQAPTTVQPPYAFQQPTAPGISQFQPAFPSGPYRPVVPTTVQTAQYPHTTTSLVQPAPQIPVQADTVMSGTNFNNNAVPQAPAAPEPAQNQQQTDSATIAESQASTDSEDSDDTSSTTDSELPEPDSLWTHKPASPQQTSASASSGKGRATTQEKTTPKKGAITPVEVSLPPSTVELLDELSDGQVDFYMMVRRSRMRKLKNIQRGIEIAELRRRVKELERQVNTQNKQFQSLESTGSQHVAALERRVADIAAQGREDRRRLEKVVALIEKNKQSHNEWDAEDGKVPF